MTTTPLPATGAQGAAASPMRVAVAGASGRMGQALIEALRASDDCLLTGALDRQGSPALGADAAAFLGQRSGVVVTADLDAGLHDAQVLIDFTRPEGTLAHLAACARLGVKAVVGTTGFDAAQKAAVQAFAARIALVLAPNMSVGVNVTFKLLELAARALASGYDVEIIEAHHRHKADAPSGTALEMGALIARAQGRELDACAVYGRHGLTGERAAQSIGFSSVRGGDLVGDHTALFAGTGERIEITHRAASRATYAQGSLRAVRFLAGQDQGLFDMFDVLGLR